MKKRILLIALSLFLYFTKSKAQDSIGISAYSVSIGNDTLPAGFTDSVSFWLVNNGATSFSDSLHFITYVQDTTGFLFHPVDTTYFGSYTIAPGDSIPFTLFPIYDVSTPVNPNRYHYDINVIVIWPIATSTGNIGGTLTYVEIITIPLGVNEIDLNKIIKAYPNPTTSNFTLENTGTIAIEEVRVFDTQGHIIQTEKKPASICTDTWKAGTYLINIQLENKQTRTIRVIKQ